MRDDDFTQLVDAYYSPLFRFALSLTRRESDACDLTQQTFYVWATKGSALRDAAKAKAWLFTTLYREFLRTRRREQRNTSFDDVPPEETAVTDEELANMRRLDGPAVMEALQRVDEVFRAPLTLFYLEEFSYLEIADALGIPLGTVMSRLSRGKAQLRAALTGREGAGKIVPFAAPRRVQQT